MSDMLELATLCQDHWDKLREAIKEAGLETLVSEDGREAATKMMRELADGPSVDSFDPLMHALWMIMGNAADVGGIGYLLGKECSLCAINDLARHAWETARDKDNLVPGQAYTCPDPTCKEQHEFPAEPTTYDGWIAFAARDTVIAWKERSS